MNRVLSMRILELDIKQTLKDNRDLRIVFAAIAFYGAACLGYFLTFDDRSLLPTWPPAGVAFALVLWMGRQVWPGITIGSLLASILEAAWSETGEAHVQTIIVIPAFTAIAHTMQALIGNALVRHWIRSDFPFTTSRNAFRFLFASILMCSAGAFIATYVLNLMGAITPDHALKTGVSWLVGNVVGVLLFTPFIVSFSRPANFRFSQEKLLEVILIMLGVMGLLFLVKVEYFNLAIQRALPFLVLPFLLWLAFRFRLGVAMGGVLVVSLLSIFFTVQNQGPFVLDDPYTSTLLLQIFIWVMSISTLVLSATVNERTVARDTLQEFNENLEAKVHERTRALHEEIAIRKEAESKLQKTNLELSKRNTELDNFVYSVSHDLRAPIASVLGLINLAKQDQDPMAKDNYLDMIHASAMQQDHFIREILDQSRNARLEVKREEVMFEPIISETFNQLTHATAAGKAVERIISIHQDRPFYSDRWRMKVILNNIISNAIRYRNGRDPVITVNVKVADNGAMVSIADNGKGIAKEHLTNVFRMFYRATDDGAGSGLGLYIVKEAVEKLNGSINIESEVGKGTTVNLLIPEVNEG